MSGKSIASLPACSYHTASLTVMPHRSSESIPSMEPMHLVWVLAVTKSLTPTSWPQWQGADEGAEMGQLPVPVE